MNLCVKVDSLLSLPNVTTVIIQNIQHFPINIMIELAYKEGGRERGGGGEERKREESSGVK